MTDDDITPRRQAAHAPTSLDDNVQACAIDACGQHRIGQPEGDKVQACLAHLHIPGARSLVPLAAGK